MWMNDIAFYVTGYYLETKILPSRNAGLTDIDTIREMSTNLVGFQRRERTHMIGGMWKGFKRPPS